MATFGEFRLKLTTGLVTKTGHNLQHHLSVITPIYPWYNQSLLATCVYISNTSVVILQYVAMQRDLDLVFDGDVSSSGRSLDTSISLLSTEVGVKVFNS